LPDINAAKKEALAAAREMLAEAIKAAREDVPDCFIVADANGQEILSVAFNEALPEKLRSRRH
jgi:hypothetical protein